MSRLKIMYYREPKKNTTNLVPTPRGAPLGLDALGFPLWGFFSHNEFVKLYDTRLLRR